MVRYGFVIDQDTCIGCHACTVACKAEHDVPLGVNRTWVKYIETGTFPNAQRKFSVMRCNHCADAPCVTVCPTTALFKRADGIVDFDRNDCIGCKACMNACPYDALYIDPETQTAAKCNYCAHKVDVGLEPSCVSVCPTQSIIAGDMDDPSTRIAQVLGRERLQVRAPEQGTGPQLFYKGADQASLDPLRSRIPADGMIWADVTPQHASLPPLGAVGGPAPDGFIDGAQVLASFTGSQRGAYAPLRPPGAGRTVYTTAHELPWKWKVSAYLVTKGAGAGALLLGALLVALGDTSSRTVRLGAPLLALAMVATTGALLTWDLKQPQRFWYMFTRRANWSSWLVKGAVVLLLFGLVALAWLIAGLAGAEPALRWLAVTGAVAGAATAGYTAPLFAQCEGRDLWQSPLLLPVLLAQAVAAGAAGLLLGAPLLGLGGSQGGIGPPLALGAGASRILEWSLASGVAVALGLYAVEVTGSSARPRGSGGLPPARPPGSGGFPPARPVEAAIDILVRGEERTRFWTAITFGVAAVALAVAGLGPVAAGAALVSLVSYEHAFVRAGQLVPLS